MMQLLKDPQIKPNNKIISECLKESYNSFNLLIEKLKVINITLTDWLYYKDGKAWLSKGEYKYLSVRGKPRIKPIFWLSIWDGFFKLSFFFDTSSRNLLLELPLNDEAKNIIKNAKSMGKTNKFISIVFDVNNDKYINDLLILSEFRKESI